MYKFWLIIHLYIFANYKVTFTLENIDPITLNKKILIETNNTTDF